MEEEIKDRIAQLATVIVMGLEEKNSVFINIQIEEEYSQYDVLFSYNFVNLGFHQRGIRGSDLLISIAGGGCHGFSIAIPDTDPSYYAEKLGVHSNFLAFLFNKVRKILKEKSQ